MSNTKLLRLVAAVPAGEPLPFARLARELGASKAVVEGMLSTLVLNGALDGETMRPPVAPPAPPPIAEGDVLLARIREAVERRKITLNQASEEIFGHGSAGAALKGKATVTAATRSKVEGWLNPSFAGLAAVRPGMLAGAFVALLDREAERAQFTAFAVSKRIFGTDTRLYTLRGQPAGRIQPATIARVLAFLESLPWSAQIEGLDELAGTLSERVGSGETEPPAALEHAAPAAPLPPEPRLPPTGKRRTRKASWQQYAAQQRAGGETAQAERERRRALGELALATKAPGETIADRIRRIGAEVDASDDEDVGELELERRTRAASNLSTPSDLIRKAQAAWPGHCAAVSAIAVEEGITVGEAWSRVIAAGIDCLKEGGSA